ncbi:MAG: DUF72 domain-containing protein [Chitinophagaceae bacterium]
MTNKKINWRIGCSGFHYKEWKNDFYPALLPQRLWFTHYAKYFNTLELNVSFYQFPKLASLQKWFADSPADFIFSLKMPRIITHYKKFNGTEQLLTDFYNVVQEGLGNKLGAVLFQMPPQFQYSAERLQLLISSVKKEFNNVVEFRHNSWWQQEVYDELAKHHIGFCSSSHPRLPDNLIINTNTVYYRFHGVPDLFRSQYDNDFLKKIADGIKENKNVTTAYLYFNNTAGPAALANAKWLQEYIPAFKK